MYVDYTLREIAISIILVDNNSLNIKSLVAYFKLFSPVYDPLKLLMKKDIPRYPFDPGGKVILLSVV